MAQALIAGLIFTFSVAVMPNLAAADDRTFVATMQRFNDNPVFALTFSMALVLTAIAAVLQRHHGHRRATRWTVAALALYGIVFAVTVAINIPLNDDLDRAGNPNAIGDLAHVRDTFEAPWVAANIVRTLFAVAAVGALARGLFLHGRAPVPHDRTSPSWPPPVPGQTIPREASVR
jgi:uncharacterized membrane protein